MWPGITHDRPPLQREIIFFFIPFRNKIFLLDQISETLLNLPYFLIRKRMHYFYSFSAPALFRWKKLHMFLYSKCSFANLEAFCKVISIFIKHKPLFLKRSVCSACTTCPYNHKLMLGPMIRFFVLNPQSGLF